MTRLDPQTIQQMIEANKGTIVADQPAQQSDPVIPPVTIEDFNKLDLRVAKVLHAEEVKESQKLLRLTVDLGDHTRTIFSAVKPKLCPDDLIGKHVVVVANLAPRKMKFGVSEGMLLLATGQDNELALVSVNDAHAGMRVR